MDLHAAVPPQLGGGIKAAAPRVAVRVPFSTGSAATSLPRLQPRELLHGLRRMSPCPRLPLGIGVSATVAQRTDAVGASLGSKSRGAGQPPHGEPHNVPPAAPRPSCCLLQPRRHRPSRKGWGDMSPAVEPPTWAAFRSPLNALKGFGSLARAGHAAASRCPAMPQLPATPPCLHRAHQCRLTGLPAAFGRPRRGAGLAAVCFLHALVCFQAPAVTRGARSRWQPSAGLSLKSPWLLAPCWAAAPGNPLAPAPLSGKRVGVFFPSSLSTLHLSLFHHPPRSFSLWLLM